MQTHTCSIELDYQLALSQDAPKDNGPLPSEQQILQWIKATLDTLEYNDDVQLTVRVVDVDEMIELNQSYRHKSGATNVLSFPFERPPGLPADEVMPLLGDIVVCASVVQKEAEQQQKPVMQHWTHMIVHGLLHLLGYDHISEGEAEHMEGIEIRVLSALGIVNPYQSHAQA